MWEGVGDRTELQHIDPHSIGHNRVSFPFSWAAQPGTWQPSLSGCWFSLPHLISNWSGLQTNWLPVLTELYNSSTSTQSLVDVTIALIQPVHGQGYILIFLERMHLLFIQGNFLFWQLGRVVGQYTTCVNTYSSSRFLIIVLNPFISAWSPMPTLSGMAIECVRRRTLV